MKANRPGNTMNLPDSRDVPLDHLTRERTSLRTIIAALIVFVVGLGLLMMVNSWDWLRDNHLSTTTFLRELSALLIVSVVAALVWELAAKRAFIDELMAKAKKSLSGIIAETRVADEVRAAGLKVFTKDFWNGIDWLSLFKEADKLDLFFAYARSWVGAYTPQLQELARRQGVRVRVVLPNPSNPELISELAHRFNKKPSQVITDIEDTVTDLMSIFVEPFEDRADKAPPNFSLYFSPKAPIFTFYRFDKLAVMALYKHLSGKGGIPVFLVEKGGSLYDFIVQEMHAFVDSDGGIATGVYPPEVVDGDCD